MEDLFASIFTPTVIARVLYALYVSLFFILPYVLIKKFWKAWLKYIRTKFIYEQKHVLLELRPPKEVLKSPLSMEIFIGVLYQTGGEATPLDKYWHGKMRPWFSLEIVSIEGTIRFYIATRQSFKKLIEATLYSQFPDIEVFESRDYTKAIPDDGSYQYSVMEYEKAKASHFPIRTYTETGLKDDPKEEHKIDPLASLFEFFSTIGRGEQLWLQIIIRAHKAELVGEDGTEDVDWTHDAKAYIKKTLNRGKEGADEKGNDKLTKSEKEVLDAVGENISKKAYDTGIRCAYVARPENFNSGMTGMLRGLFAQFQTVHMNGLKGGQDDFDYPWQDWSGKKGARKQANIFNLFKQRGYFPPLYKGKFFFHVPFFRPDSVNKLRGYFVMSSEELASIYHFPSATVLKTPTIVRSDTKRGEAPANLPI